MLTSLYFLGGVTVLGLYSWWQRLNYRRWLPTTLRSPELPESLASPAVSILIPARNEATTIGLLINDLLAQKDFNSPDEIIVINDHSTDDTATIVRSFSNQVRLLELSDYVDENNTVAHKKAALTYAVSQAVNPLIVTTDADCRWSSTVLTQIKRSAASGNEFISGPVLTAGPTNQLSGFQALDLAAYMMLTAAYQAADSPILANGAHLSFTKSLFQEIGGYAGIDHLPSGDDVLLLQKIQQVKPLAKIDFINCLAAVVTTQPMPDWRSFWEQRIRWAGKTGHYDSSALYFAQAISFATSLVLMIGLLLTIVEPKILIWLLLFWLTKIGVDYFLLRAICRHFNREEWLRFYPFAALFQPFYLVVVGCAALLGIRVAWKGRVSD